MGSLKRSCQACVKARRKCNRATPCCKRCSAKRLLCRYQDEPASASAGVQAKTSRNINGSHIIPADPHSKDLSRLVEQGSLDTKLQMFVRQVLGDWHYQGSRPPLPESALWYLQDLGEMNNTPGNGTRIFNPLHLEIVRVFDPVTLQRLSEILRSFPSQFAQHGSAPFIHPGMHDPELLSPLKEVREMCSSYSIGGEYLTSDRLAALRHTTRRLLRLSKRTTTFAENLAYAQAITLAQIICLLGPHDFMEDDDDERDNMEMWALVHQLWQHAPTQLSPNLSPWKAWLFSENVRRTIVVCNILLAVYSSLKRGYAIHSLCIETLPFDARTKLWDVKDEATWFATAGEITDPCLVALSQFADLQHASRGGTQFEDILTLWYGK
ncbi:hypothetical protein CC79DRAFT_193776 [Sarocladium strictum]